MDGDPDIEIANRSGWARFSVVHSFVVRFCLHGADERLPLHWDVFSPVNGARSARVQIQNPESWIQPCVNKLFKRGRAETFFWKVLPQSLIHIVFHYNSFVCFYIELLSMAKVYTFFGRNGLFPPRTSWQQLFSWTWIYSILMND